MRALISWVQHFTIDTWREIDAESLAYRAAHPERSLRDLFLTAYIFTVVAVSLVLQETYDEAEYLIAITRYLDGLFNGGLGPVAGFAIGWLRPADGSLTESVLYGGYYELWVLSYWAAWRVFGFLILPLIAVRAHPELRRAQIGWSTRGMLAHWKVYLLLLAIVLFAVGAVSFLEEFQDYYPFYRNAQRSVFDFAVWEAFYFAQFLSLEFFFRGFMIQPLRKTMGTSAIFAMMIPYVMIHIGKPVLECLGAVLAGVILGTLAMKTRSIWSGFLIHVSVAISMDLAAIWQVHWR